MIYLDTSYLVRLYFEDPGFEAVRELAASDHVVCTALGQAETIAAFHRKLREKAISPSDYAALVAQFEADHLAGGIKWLTEGVEVHEKVRHVYTRLPGDIFLRGADALHLASAATHGHQVVYSNDAHFLAAAPHFGLKSKNILKPT